MSPFAHHVSRKLLATVALFAVAAATLVAGYAVVGGGGPDTTTANLVTDAQALDDALADPAVALEGTATAADPTAPSGPRSQLRADLRAAFELQGDARRQALADVRTKAQNGGYGDRIEHRADRREIRRELFFNLLPDNLQSDLQALRSAPADQRPQMRQDILDKALAGDYGADVQNAAKELQQLRKG